ncbi:GNAT family N-acetyltransferase [Streptomyces sp. NPDC057555]|uniref:GNAT family N-acetyltransferase n=1 Tax=Streptomyces sp. NPDC057555 TaxID=3346166 RepID=UPI0036AF9B9D
MAGYVLSWAHFRASGSILPSGYRDLYGGKSDMRNLSSLSRKVDHAVLVELATRDYARIEPLFGSSCPNLAFVRAVLHEKIPGRVWADLGQGAPVACLVATTSPFCFAAGSMSPDFFHAAYDLLKGHGAVQLVHPPEPGVDALAVDAGFTPARRLQWGQPSSQHWTAPAMDVPKGYELARIDGPAFGRLDSPMARSIFGSAADYAEHGIGFALHRDGQVAADAHGVIGGDLIELGFHTHPDHRGRGLATALAAHVSRWGTENGLRSVMTFSEHKQASKAIARRIGLVEEFSYPTVELP